MIIADTEGVLKLGLKLGETIGCNQNVLDDLKKDIEQATLREDREHKVGWPTTKNGTFGLLPYDYQLAHT